ncbi:MAG TPA: hypothetical protein VF711_11480, partial [Acidimicrobiales bacterium]
WSVTVGAGVVMVSSFTWCLAAQSESSERTQQLNATIERAAADHVESNIGVAVVNPFPPCFR